MKNEKYGKDFEKKLEDASKKHWEDFKKSDAYGMVPYIPILMSAKLLSLEDLGPNPNE